MISLKTFIPIFGVVLLTMTGCQQAAKTSSDAPNAAGSNIETPTAESTKSSQDDATSKVRRDQLNSDIRAREQRNNTINNSQAMNRSDKDIASEVRSKLEANLPASALTVSAKSGAVMITGTVSAQAQLDRINGLAKEIKGVTAVTMKVAVGPAKK